MINYKGYNLRFRILFAILGTCLISILLAFGAIYIVLKKNTAIQNLTDRQNKTEALMASLDYAISHKHISTNDLSNILNNKIYEIADINKHDIIIYNLKGEYLISNRDISLVEEKQIPEELVQRIFSSPPRIDIETFDKSKKNTITSSYMILKNNMLEPIAIVYFPYYHNNEVYSNIIKKYWQTSSIIILVIFLAGFFSSIFISKSLTKTLTRFAEQMSNFNVFDQNLQPIKYYKNDLLDSLIKSYNRMINRIQNQTALLSMKQKEEAWREMAKQVAHEVKNPLTPMRLMIQNFERKFDPQDPNIKEKLSKMTSSIIDQIDLIAKVATAFSQFSQLPKKHNEILNLNKEISQILTIFNDNNIHLHSNKENIMINMDKIYLSRIITNLITNAQQAAKEETASTINVYIEQYQKRITISIEDNGIGISEKILPKIFEPNFTSKSSGMGLGLTMVKKMIEDYHGEIIVHSEEGKGTTFTITLPSNL